MDEIYESLKNPKSIDEISIPLNIGIYAFYTNSKCFLNTQLNQIESEECIYIGIAQDETLNQRILGSHFSHSGQSTFRRSLGAILRNKLNLDPIMRGVTVTKSNISNFRFCSESEKKLTNFMNQNLLIAFKSFNVTEHNLNDIEKKLIDKFGFPAFNLEYVGIKSKYYQIIKEARKECRNIVKQRIDQR
ncbi:MAG: GIY-YIG nuclease family protein [Deltaproteobacteria bacterium]